MKKPTLLAALALLAAAPGSAEAARFYSCYGQCNVLSSIHGMTGRTCSSESRARATMIQACGRSGVVAATVTCNPVERESSNVDATGCIRGRR